MANTKTKVKEWAKANGLDGYATADLGPGGRRANRIPGGAKDGSGKPGYADVIFWGKNAVYIWEVKIATYDGRKEARQQVNRYQRKLQDKLDSEGDGREVRLGGALPSQGNIESAEGKQRAWSETRIGKSGISPEGVRFYGPQDRKKKDPLSRGRQVKRPNVNERTAQPTPTPRPVSDGAQEGIPTGAKVAIGVAVVALFVVAVVVTGGGAAVVVAGGAAIGAAAATP